MKKTILVLFIILGTYIFIGLKTQQIIEIPDEAIRIRIIGNSNSDYDQKKKEELRKNVQLYMQNLLKDTENITQARETINKNLDNIDKEVNNYLTEIKYDKDYNINFGLNYFPKKEYKGIKYNEGLYESLLITLGEGKGNNWWCVLFPPICLLEAEETETNDIEYKSFIKEIIEKYF